VAVAAVVAVAMSTLPALVVDVGVAGTGLGTDVPVAGESVEVTVGPAVQPAAHTASAIKGTAIRIHRAAFAFMVPTLWAAQGPSSQAPIRPALGAGIERVLSVQRRTPLDVPGAVPDLGKGRL